MKNKRRVIIFATIVVLLFCLLFFGYKSFERYNSKEKYDLKENEVLFKNYVYELPIGWKLDPNNDDPGFKVFELTEMEDKLYTMGAIINVHKISSTGYTEKNLFKDSNLLKKMLADEGYTDIEEGKIVEYKSVPMIVFSYEYGNNLRKLIAYMPAYDNYFYSIHLYSSFVENGKENMFLNYNALFHVFDFLNTGKKV